MDKLRTLSLFAGIGGIDLGLERTGGFETTAFVEVDPYCQAVLRKHWPHVPIYGDVREFHASEGQFDVIAGGFPCQPVSLAGKRKGQADERWLWPEFARLIGEARPSYVLVENVRGLCSKGLPEVLADLAGLGYDAEWQVVSAASLGAPHIRERVLLVAYPRSAGRPEDSRGAPADEGPDGRRSQEDHVPNRDGEGGRARDVADPDGLALEWTSKPREQRDPWAVESDVGRVAHGVPSRVDRLRCLGNAVVPQVAEFVGGLILDAERRA